MSPIIKWWQFDTILSQFSDYKLTLLLWEHRRCKTWQCCGVPGWFSFHWLGLCVHPFPPNISFPLHLFHLAPLRVVSQFYMSKLIKCKDVREIWINLWVIERWHLSFSFTRSYICSCKFITKFPAYEMFSMFLALIACRFWAQLHLSNGKCISMQQEIAHS